jgi:hypothetical protein
MLRCMLGMPCRTACRLNGVGLLAHSLPGPDVQLPNPPTQRQMTLRHQPESAFSHSLWLTLMVGSLLTLPSGRGEALARLHHKYYEMIETD